MHTECFGGMEDGRNEREKNTEPPQLIPECYTSAVRVAVKYCKCKKSFGWKNIMSVNDATIM